jgi:hypothetical protein
VKKDFLNMRMIHSGILAIIAAFMIFAFLECRPALAQGHNGGGSKVGVKGFIDEDGDGFNDLLPDSDGDGVPDILDPDSRAYHGDSLANGRGMHERADSTRMGHQRMVDDSLHVRMQEGPGMFGPGGYGMGDPGQYHGEPGQYGPGDSSMHGGMCPDDSMGGHHGGMGPDGGGMGPGPQKIGGDNPSDGPQSIEKGNVINERVPHIDAGQPRQEIKQEARGR